MKLKNILQNIKILHILEQNQKYIDSDIMSLNKDITTPSLKEKLYYQIMQNYAEADEKWKQDREFVANYEFGSVPEVLIDEVIVGKRK